MLRALSRHFATRAAAIKSTRTKAVSVFQLLGQKADKKSLSATLINDSDMDEYNNTLFTQGSIKKTHTNLKKQIDAIQAQHPTHILFVQVGMFYEIYGEYMEEMASLLGLRVAVHKSSSNETEDHRYHKFTGFPMISLRNHLDTLLANGKTVAIVDQLRPIPPSTTILRKVTRIITPGTLVDENDLKDNDNNFLLSVYPTEKGNSVGLAWLDVSTGEFNLSISTINQLMDDITRIQPKEILIPSNNESLLNMIKDSGALITCKPAHFFSSQDSLARLATVIISNDPAKAIFASSPDDVLKGLKPSQPQAAGALLTYLAETFPSSAPSIRTPLEVFAKDSMKLDACTIDSLEITHTQRDRSKKGSLLSVLDKTKTAAGHRLLSARMKAPSTICSEINRRLDLVKLFYDDSLLNMGVTELLDQCKDIERSLQRIHFETGSPLDLFNVIQTLALSLDIKKLLMAKLKDILKPDAALSGLIKQMGNFENLSSHLAGMLNEENLNSSRGSAGFIQSGVSDTLDLERAKHEALIQKQERRSVELSNLLSKSISTNFRNEMHTIARCEARACR